MLEQHYYLMGTQLRNYSENKPIARVHRMTFDIVRSLPSRRRILEETFYRRFARELKKRKVSSLSKQDLFNIASMINMFIWWFPFERVKISRKTRWRHKIAFFQNRSAKISSSGVTKIQQKICFIQTRDINKVVLNTDHQTVPSRKRKARRSGDKVKKRNINAHRKKLVLRSQNEKL